MFIVSFHNIKYPNLPYRRDFLFDIHPAHNIWHIAGITYETNNTTYDTFILDLPFFQLFFAFVFFNYPGLFLFQKWAESESST